MMLRLERMKMVSSWKVKLISFNATPCLKNDRFLRFGLNYFKRSILVFFLLNTIGNLVSVYWQPNNSNSKGISVAHIGKVDSTPLS